MRSLTRAVQAFGRASHADYLALDLRAHHYLAEVPLHDAWHVFLPGEDRACTMEIVRAVARAAITERRPTPTVRALFALRRMLGRLFHWDDPPPHPHSWSLRTQLTELDRQRSLVEPGSLDGPFAVVYVHPSEAVSEIRNATVHAFLVWAVAPAPDGHVLFLAIHVRSVSPWTGLYLAMIDPFRRWIVYPFLLRRFHDAWCSGLAVTAGPEPS